MSTRPACVLPRRYDAVLFDVDDTLLDFNASEEAACRHVFDLAASPSMSPASCAAAFLSVHPATWDLYMSNAIRRDDVVRVTFEKLAAMGYLKTMDPAEAAGIYQNWFVLHSVPEPGALQTLALLRKEYRTGVISNYEYADVQRQRLAGSGLADLLDVVVISGDSGVEKPDPAIFDKALHLLGLGRDRCLFVGDSRISDAAGALAAGIDFCWYRRHHAGAPPQAAFVITSLTKLPGLISVPPRSAR